MFPFEDLESETPQRARGRHAARPVSRRTLLSGAAVGAAATAAALVVPRVASGAAAQTSMAAGIAPLAPPPPAQPWMRIGPQSISDPSQVYYLPKDANLVRWRWARGSGTTIQDAVATLGANDILVLPEDEKPYEIDSSRGFAGVGAWKAMVRVKRGIVGLGPGAVIRPRASSYRAGQQSGKEGLQEKLIETVSDGAFFGNFTMLGRSFGGVGYHGIGTTGNRTIFQDISFRGAHRGWMAAPPGEAGAIMAYKGWGVQVRNVEIDGRDPDTGESVGSSPIMFNRNERTIVTDTWMHHTRIGMPTWWECHDAWTERIYHEHVAQGPNGWSPGVNVENCSGTFTFIDPTFNIEYRGSHGNTGVHVNVGGSRGTTATIKVRGAKFDSSPAPGKLAIQQYGAQRDGMAHYDVRGKDGQPAPYVVRR